MPVPLPPEADTNLRPPDSPEVELLARGTVSAIRPPGGLTELQTMLFDEHLRGRDRRDRSRGRRRAHQPACLRTGARPAQRGVPQAHGARELRSAWAECVDDPALVAQWEALGDLPAGTIGRGMFEFYEARGFVFPGRPGSAPPLLAQHDWVHVLADSGLFEAFPGQLSQEGGAQRVADALRRGALSHGLDGASPYRSEEA